MNQKIALILAVSLTAFVLVVGGAIAGRVSQPAAGAITPTATDIQSVYAQREAEYQARLDEANQALAEAYAAQSAASPNVAAPTAVVPQAQITPQEAMFTAVITAPGAKILSTPELVNFQGTLAYEVKLDQGLVYIDASNGAVLYNGTAQSQSLAPVSGAHDDDHDSEHKDNDD